MSCPSFPGCASVPIEADSIVGTAPDEEAYLILELPKPWPAKIKKMNGLVSGLRGVLKKHKTEDVKLIGTPEIPWLEPAEQPRALLLRWDGERALHRVVTAEPETLRQALGTKPQGDPFECYIVCTHGSRDPCCGLQGVPIYRALAASGHRKVLQVSHLGGHRFAPVIGVFPEWKFYGHLTTDTCLDMDAAFAQGLPFLHGYRGNGRLKGGVQVVEARLWQEHGSDLVCVRMVSGDKKKGALLEARFKNGRKQHYQAEFERFEYRGFKSCEDYRKGEESKFKLPRLKSLRECSMSPDL